MTDDDARFMAQALAAARAAGATGEVPVGALVVCDGAVIGNGANRRTAAPDPTGHAEIVALREAAAHIGDWRLERCVLYVTLEPCVMCAGAIVHARVPRVVYGCDDPKFGAVRSLYRVLDDPRANHRCIVVPGVEAEASAALLQQFFAARRVQIRAARARRGGRAAEGA